MQLTRIDLVIVIVFMLAMLTIGLVVATRKKMTGNNYFLAGRSLSWVIVGASLFASNISTIHLVGLSASGYREGLVWGNFEWGAPFILIILGLVFAPFYFKNKVSTLPEFLEKRYNATSRTFLAILGLFTALMVHIGLSLYAGAVVIEQFFGLDIYVSIGVIATIIVIYTVLGGLKAVVITETIQSSILVTGSILLTLFAIRALPDYGIHSYSDLVAAARPDQLSIIPPVARERSGLTWYALLFGYPVIGIWYWCGDQTIVQRLLGARSERDATIGPMFAGFIKILPVLIMVLPGVLGYVMFKDIIQDNSNETLPVMISRLLPVGIKGVLAASLIAAIMSTVSAALNSSGTIIAVDVFKRLKPGLSDNRLVLIGRISTVVFMLVAVLWSTQGGKFNSIFEAANLILSMVSPPIATLFVLGVFWRRGTHQAATSTMILGFAMGAVIFCIDFFSNSFTGSAVVSFIRSFHFLLQGVFMFIICLLNFLVVSYCTPEPRPQQIEGLTLERPLSFITGKKISGISDPRIIAGILIVIMLVLYFIFR
jgi:SSS family solute:Na+ symporter